MLAAFLESESVLDTPAPNVFLEGIENGRLIFNAKGYVNTPRNAYSVRSALLYSILERLGKANIALSTPSTVLLSSPEQLSPP